LTNAAVRSRIAASREDRAQDERGKGDTWWSAAQSVVRCRRREKTEMKEPSKLSTTAGNIGRDREGGAGCSLPAVRQAVVTVTVVLIPLIILLVSTG
jgi:hypothetical protein